MSAGLRAATTLVGIALCALSIMLNFQLYSSLTGSSNLEQFSYQYIGVSLDIAKVLCLLLASYFWFKSSDGRAVLLGSFCFIFYVALSSISLSAGWGFGLNATANGERERLASSYTMKAFEGQIEEGKQKASNFASFANVDSTTLKAKQGRILVDIETATLKLSKCPRNWFTNCINPANAELREYRRQLAEISTQLKGKASYQAGISEQNTAAMQIGKLDGSQMGTQVFHPLFIAMGDLFLVTPRQAKQVLLLITFVVLELLGTLLFTIGLISSNKGQSSHTAVTTGFVKSEKSPAHRLRVPSKKASSDQPMASPDQPMASPDQTILARADSDVEGENANRFTAIKNAVIAKDIKPTLAEIQRFKRGGIGCNRIVAKRFQMALEKEGLIKPYTLNNGKTSYRLIKQSITV